MNSIKERNEIGYEVKDEQTYFEQTQEIEHVGICDYTNIIVYTKSKRCFISPEILPYLFPAPILVKCLK